MADIEFFRTMRMRLKNWTTIKEFIA